MQRFPLILFIFLTCALAVSAQEPVRLALELDRSHYVARQENNAYLRATIRTGEPVGAVNGPPLNLAFAVDRSGSMEGEKLASVKHAIRDSLARLSSSDSFALVAFGSQTETLIPARSVDQLDDAEPAIASLRAEGGSALFDGISLAAAQLRRNLGPNRVNRIIVICDGPPTKGPRQAEDFARLAQSLAMEGITISVVGLGNDHPEEILYQLTSATGSPLRHALHPDALGKSVYDEISSLNTAFARDAVLEIEFEGQTRVRESVGRVSEIQGHSIRFRFDHLYPHQERVAVAQATLAADLGAFGRARIARATLTYTPVGTENGATATVSSEVRAQFTDSARLSYRSLNSDVIRTVCSFEIEDSIREAFVLFDEGDTAQAIKDLRSTARSIGYINDDLDDLDVDDQLHDLTVAISAIEDSGPQPIDRRALTTLLYQHDQRASVANEAASETD